MAKVEPGFWWVKFEDGYITIAQVNESGSVWIIGSDVEENVERLQQDAFLQQIDPPDGVPEYLKD